MGHDVEMTKTTNPYCECDPCNCPPPCKCGLNPIPVSISTSESWDRERGALTMTTRITYVKADDAGS